MYAVKFEKDGHATMEIHSDLLLQKKSLAAIVWPN